jgi:hypothetical protein
VNVISELMSERRVARDGRTLIFDELEKASVPGVVRGSPHGTMKYDFSETGCPEPLRNGAVEASAICCFTVLSRLNRKLFH